MRKLLPLLLCVILLTSCMTVVPSPTTPASSTTTPAGTTPPPGVLDELTALMHSNRAKSAASQITYDDPAIGKTLTAETALTVGEEDTEPPVTFAYSYDRLNPIGSAEFVSRVTDSIEGTMETVSSAFDGMYGWVKAPDFALTGLSLSPDCFSDLRLTGEGNDLLLTASVKDDSVEALFGSTLGGASAVTLTVSYSPTEIAGMTVSYTVGAATVLVTVTFGYEK